MADYLSPVVAIPATARIDRLRVTIDTGKDNLRGDSVAKLIVIYKNHAMGQESLNLNLGQEWGTGKPGAIDVQLSSQPIWANFDRLAIEFENHPQGLESQDNWDMNSVQVEVLNDDGTLGPVVAVGGAVRFTGGVTHVEIPFLTDSPAEPLGPVK
jgi:hypothetical protein